MDSKFQNKVIVILGPTASGKSGLAVKIAKKWNGEIISADSRQVYKELDIGAGKVTKKEMAGVPHHLLDIADPKRRFTVAEFQEMAREKISEIFSRGKIPIICGGTGFYIKSVVDNIALPNVPPNEKLRKELSGKSADELFAILKKLNPKRAKNIDPKNSRRLIRAIEIASVLNSPFFKGSGESSSRGISNKILRLQSQPPSFLKEESAPRFLQIGIQTPDQILKQKIRSRLLARLKKGMIAEAKRLHQRGLSWKRMDELGLEYRYLSRYLQNKISKEEMTTKLKTEIWHFARRQKTWWRKDARIKWFSISDTKKIEKEIKNFLKKTS